MGEVGRGVPSWALLPVLSLLLYGDLGVEQQSKEQLYLSLGRGIQAGA